jgi:hypothetical protein
MKSFPETARTVGCKWLPLRKVPTIWAAVRPR